MDKTPLQAAPVLGGVDMKVGENRILERSDLAIVSVAIPQGGGPALKTALKRGWNLDMPEPTLSTRAGEVRALSTTPDQIMLIFPHDTPDAEPVVRAKLEGSGYTTDQTDVWVVLSISGPDTLAAMARICPLDLDLVVFPHGASARTSMEHMGAIIVRLGDQHFLLLSASSSAASFLHAVETSYWTCHGRVESTN